MTRSAEGDLMTIHVVRLNDLAPQPWRNGGEPEAPDTRAWWLAYTVERAR